MSHTITPVSEQITTQFHLPTELLGICDKYYILYWNSRYLYTQLLRSPRVVREGIAYVPVLQESISLQYLGANPDSQIRLSFRRIRGHRTGYVIIRSIPIVSFSKSPTKSLS